MKKGRNHRDVKTLRHRGKIFPFLVRVSNIRFSKCSGEDVEYGRKRHIAASMPQYAFPQRPVGELLR